MRPVPKLLEDNEPMTQRLPDAVKAARGTLRPCRSNSDAPRPETVAELPAPRWLDRTGRDYWRLITREMARMGYLAPRDVAATN